jgi:outer membrane protein assembly factor BamB
VAIVFAAAMAPAARGADWPQWGGRPDKNMVSGETGLPESFVPGEKDPQGGGIKMETTQNVKWTARLGAMTCSTPAVAGGKVFIGTMRDDQGALLCLDEATGAPLWQWMAPAREVPATIDDRRFEFGRFPKQLGVCSSPAVDGDRLYFVTHRLEVLCLAVNGRPRTGPPPAVHPAAKPKTGRAGGKPPEAAPKGKAAPPSPETKALWPTGPRDAETIWMFDIWNLGVRPSDACNCSPVVYGDFVYVCTANGVDRQAEANKHDEFRKVPAPTAPNLIVLEKKTGRLVAMDNQPVADRLFHGQWSSPSVGQVGAKTLVFFGGGDGRCYAFEAPSAAGARPAILKKVWSVDCIPPEYHAFGGLDMITHYCRGDRRRSDTLNKNDGSFVGMSEIIATPVFYKNRVYVAIGRDPEHGRGRGALWCIDATGTGDITRTGKVWCYQGIDRSLSTVSIADGLLYACDVGGRLHCLDAETGNLYWVHETLCKTWGSTLVADGKIYMPTDKGLVVLAAGKQTKVLGKISLGSPEWPTPVAANGVLYVASTRYLWAVRQAAGGPAGPGHSPPPQGSRR